MKEKTDRNRRLYQYHLQHPNMSYANIGRVFQHKLKDKLQPLSSSAICRILKREKQHLELKPRQDLQSRGY